MHALTGWFIRNPVAANLIMVLILFLGVQTALSIRIEGFPRLPAETITIETVLDNATAQQIDAQVTTRIERALEGLDGVRSVSSRSGDGRSTVTIRRTADKDLGDLLDAARIRIDGISGLPARAERPVLEAAPFDLPALYLNLSGAADVLTQQRLGRQLREALLERPELSRIRNWGLVPREIRVALDPHQIQALGMTVADVADRIRQGSVDARSGQLRTQGGSILLRADTQAMHPSEFAAIPIIERNDGRDVRLGDIARINEAFVDAEFLFRFNGRPTVGMEVLVGRDENLLKISRVVHDVVEEFEPLLPAGVEVTVWGDAADYIADRLALLRSNGVQGLFLVLVLLSLFLNVRLAFWVAMGIPVSVMGALAVSGTRWVDYSLNDVTTFGLIIALGILVDDAVVVGESVYESRTRIPDPVEATEKGVRHVALATVFGTATTIAAFFPMLLIDNEVGRVLASFSGIVILALLFSLLESKFILPAHLAHTRLGEGAGHRLARAWSRLQALARGGLHWMRDRPYRAALEGALRHRYAVLIAFLAAGILGIGLIAKGQIRTVFFPEVPGQIITVSMQMDARAPFGLTRANLDRIETAGMAMSAALAEEAGLEAGPIRSVFYLVPSAESAMLFAELTPTAARPGLPVDRLVREWRARAGRLEGATELQFSGSEALAGGFEFRLFSRDRDALRGASAALRDYLGSLDGLSNIRDSFAGGQPQFTLRLRPEALGLGITPASLAGQIGNGFGGAEAQRISRDGREIKVMVRLDASARDTIGDLMTTRIRTEAGVFLPLTTVAEIEGGYVPAAIERFNGQLVSTVAASVDRGIVAPEEAAQAVMENFAPDMGARFPGVELRPGGELEEIGEVQDGLKRALMLAAVLIYVLLAIPLKSYWQPVIILAIIPFGFIGAAIGHLIMDLPLSALSFFGMLALSGVVVNDSLVLLTRYRQMRETGLTPFEAIREAAQSRFRAIFLTTATTVIGLLPLLTETSEQAQYLIPAAVSLAFGEIFATALMLLLVPVLVLISEDVRRLLWRTESKGPQDPEVEAAP